MIQMFDLDLQSCKLKPITYLDILVNVKFSHLPLHYVWKYSFMSVHKKCYQSVSDLSKECNNATTVNLVVKLKRVVSALCKYHNCSVGIETVGNPDITYHFHIFFTLISS